MRFVAMAAVGVMAFAAANVPFAKREADFRSEREANLKKPDGWLSVAGLFWLHDGAMTLGSDPQSDVVLPAGAPRKAGVLRMQGGVVTLEPAAGAGVLVNGKPAVKMALKPDTDPHTDVVQAGKILLTIIKRGDRTGVRMRNPD